MVRTSQGMTVQQLHKRLGQMIEEGRGRQRVHVEIESFRNTQGATVCQVHGLGLMTVQILDDDGFCAINAQGAHVEKVCVTLVGARMANGKGEIVD